MNERQLLLKAADQIENHQGSYSFCKTRLPTRHDPTGCLIGWMAHYAGHWSWFGKALADDRRCVKVLGVNSGVLFSRMDDAMNSMKRASFVPWSTDAETAAACLRLYADKYHPDAYTKFRAALSLEPKEDVQTESVQTLLPTESR